MPDATRIYCTRCKQSVFNCLIDGQRTPIVWRINGGQPDDTGPAFDVNGPGVRVTSFTREMMQTQIARIELCELCFAELLGLPLVTAEADPLYDADQDGTADAQQIDPTLPHVERFARMHARALEALTLRPTPTA